MRIVHRRSAAAVALGPAKPQAWKTSQNLEETFENLPKLVSELLSRFVRHLTLPWLEQPLFAGEQHRASQKASGPGALSVKV